MVLRRMAYSPRRRIRLATVAGELTTCPHPVGPTRLRRLDQQRVPGPHAFAVRFSAVRLARCDDRSRVFTRPAHPFAPTLPRPPHPTPTFVTIASRPSYGVGCAGRNHIFLKNRSNLFFARGLDRNSQTPPVGQISRRKNERRGCDAATSCRYFTNDRDGALCRANASTLSLARG
jgi:hypothetical protein